jgi:hypothetical protein
MAEPAAQLPSLDEAKAWRGRRVDEAGGKGVGEVHGVFVDASDGQPAWLISKQGPRFRRTLVASPLRDCAGGAGRVWVAHPGEVIRSSPAVDPRRPLLREHELAICAHYGIGERVGRAAEVVRREAGSITSRPN